MSENKLFEAMALHMGVMRWVDCFTVGRNNGGIYVRLFYSRAKFSIIVVYDNDFKKLPGWMGELATKEGAKLQPSEESVTQLESAKKKGMVRECPRMIILRYQLNPGEDLEQWRFHGVHWVAADTPKATPKPDGGQNGKPESSSTPPRITTQGEAWAWAISRGAYDDVTQAKTAYEGLKQRTNLTGQSLLSAWLNLVEGVVRDKNKRKERA